jgi:hypothetical protein
LLENVFSYDFQRESFECRYTIPNPLDNLFGNTAYRMQVIEARQRAENRRGVPRRPQNIPRQYHVPAAMQPQPEQEQQLPEQPQHPQQQQQQGLAQIAEFHQFSDFEQFEATAAQLQVDSAFTNFYHESSFQAKGILDILLYSNRPSDEELVQYHERTFNSIVNWYSQDIWGVRSNLDNYLRAEIATLYQARTTRQHVLGLPQLQSHQGLLSAFKVIESIQKIKYYHTSNSYS